MNIGKAVALLAIVNMNSWCMEDARGLPNNYELRLCLEEISRMVQETTTNTTKKISTKLYKMKVGDVFQDLASSRIKNSDLTQFFTDLTEAVYKADEQPDAKNMKVKDVFADYASRGVYDLSVGDFIYELEKRLSSVINSRIDKSYGPRLMKDSHVGPLRVNPSWVEKINYMKAEMDTFLSKHALMKTPLAGDVFISLIAQSKQGYNLGATESNFFDELLKKTMDNAKKSSFTLSYESMRVQDLYPDFAAPTHYRLLVASYLDQLEFALMQYIKAHSKQKEKIVPPSASKPASAASQEQQQQQQQKESQIDESLDLLDDWEQERLHWEKWKQDHPAEWKKRQEELNPSLQPNQQNATQRVPNVSFNYDSFYSLFPGAQKAVSEGLKPVWYEILEVNINAPLKDKNGPTQAYTDAKKRYHNFALEIKKRKLAEKDKEGYWEEVYKELNHAKGGLEKRYNSSK